MGRMLNMVMGRRDKKPPIAYLRFDDEFIVEIDRDEFKQARELIEKVGENRFDDVERDCDFEVFETKSLAEFTKWLTDETDLLVEHDPDYWNGPDEGE